MSWLTDFVGPRLREIVGSEPEESLEPTECPACKWDIAPTDPRAALRICPRCEYHFPLPVDERLRMVFDDAVFHSVQLPQVPSDPLRFRDVRKYPDRLREAQAKTGRDDGLVVAHGTVGGVRTVAAVVDPAFLDGSIGVGVGAGLATAARLSALQQAPLIMFAGPTSPRICEGLFAVSQLSRIAMAAEELRSQRLMFVLVLAEGLSSPFADALAGFADVTIVEGRAVAAFGDLVVTRAETRDVLARILGLVTQRRPAASVHPLRAVTAEGPGESPCGAAQANPDAGGPEPAGTRDAAEP